MSDAETVAYRRKALSDYPNDRGQVLRSGMDAALNEIDRLRGVLAEIAKGAQVLVPEFAWQEPEIEYNPMLLFARLSQGVLFTEAP